MAASARKTAFAILLKIEKDGAYSNLALDSALKEYELSPQDKRLVSAIVYGVTERKITLDHNLSLYLTQPVKKLKKDVLCALRMGAYQIFFMDKIPDSAAVNESVKLSKVFRFQYASGMINAVLRKCSANSLVLPDENDAAYLSVKESCPQWLVDMLISQYGKEDTELFLEDSLKAPKLTVRVNTLKTSTEKLQQQLSDEGVESTQGIIENSLELKLNGKSISSLSAYKNGLFHVQDIASQLCAKAVGAKENSTVFDLCSAPGGKAFTIAQYMKNKGKIKAFDLYEQRAKLISSGAKRLGIKIIETSANNAEKFNFDLGSADTVLCDVPCSGLGIIRRKPEIRYKSKEEIDALPEIQSRILSTSAAYVKEGGRLIYSTCTINKNENEKVCEAFLKEHDDFEPASLFGGEECFATYLPHKDSCDGFFIAAFSRKKNQ